MRGGPAAAGRGRDPARQDQRLRVLDVLGLVEPAVRLHAQPARPRAHRGRLVGRRGVRGGVRDVGARARLGPRRLDPRARALLRRLRAARRPRHDPDAPRITRCRPRRACGRWARSGRWRARSTTSSSRCPCSPRRAAAARGRARRRVRGRRAAAGQPRRAARRCGSRPRRSTPSRRSPPGQAEARRLFDAILGEEIGGLPTFVGDRDAELAPYNRGAVAFARTFEPSIERYITAFDDLAALEDDAARVVRATTRSCCARSRSTSRRRWGSSTGRRSTASRRGRAASSRSARTRTCSGCRRSRCRSARDGLPVGVQLIGWHGSERTLIALARRLA